MLNIEIINNPSKSARDIIMRKVGDMEIKEKFSSNTINSIGLIQGQLSEIIVAADIAEKASEVSVAEVNGTCPQHITMICVLGDTASVETAIKAIENWVKKSKGEDDGRLVTLKNTKKSQ